MEIKKGIVKSVQANGNLKLQHGMFFKFEIEIGEDVGEYLSKSEDGGNKNFPVGQEKEYQLTENKFGKNKRVAFGGGLGEEEKMQLLDDIDRELNKSQGSL